MDACVGGRASRCGVAAPHGRLPARPVRPPYPAPVVLLHRPLPAMPPYPPPPSAPPYPPRRRALAAALAALLLAVILAAAPAGAQSSDAVLDAYTMRQGWFTRDKAYHFGASALGAAALYVAGRELGLGRWGAVGVSASLMATAGLIWELNDEDDPRMLSATRFSRKDMAWNGIGIVVGIGVPDLALPRWRRNGPPPTTGGEARP